MSTKHTQFEALVQAYSADLYRFAYWLTHDRQLAEDLIQETFLRAWRGLDSLQDSKNAKPWLITILKRELARKYEKLQPEMVELDDSVLDLSAVHVPDNADIRLLLQQALKKLPVNYREPLILQVLAGYSCDEIATALETEVGTIMTRLFRARQQLKKVFEDRTIMKFTSGTKK